MKQILQSARTGELALVEVPTPVPEQGQVLVRNRFSVVSAGTESQALSFARMSILAKARSRPDLVAQVRRKLREEGPLSTYRTAMSRLDSPQPLGYSCAGLVEAVGSGVTRFAAGDPVACAGAGYANHAEFVVVPQNLVARVPPAVALEQAAFATLGAIAIQGLRVAQPTLGEVAAVIGLGLIGQLTVQLLRANGCRVLGVDVAPARVEEALAQGAEWAYPTDHFPASWKQEMTDGHGVDLAIVTASSSTSDPLDLAAELCRHKGRISMVGSTRMELERRTFYEKELELRMSTSYGPGRYDRSYEERGLDYPMAYVRWTENRNLQAFLQLSSSGHVDTSRLATETIPFAQAGAVYEDLARGQRKAVALIFEYPTDVPVRRSVALATPAEAPEERASIGVAFVGAGNYAKGVLLPALVSHAEARRVALVTATGASARRTSERFGFPTCGTDPEAIFSNPDVDLVFIATRHDTHAELAIRALRAGKAVWLEKPVALASDELDRVAAAVTETGGFLAVGYNRRFSPHARAVRSAFDQRLGPLGVRYTISAGAPPGGWTMDPEEGGGRVIGEVCHFVDLCTYLVGAPPTGVYARSLARGTANDDSIVATLGFSDGSTAVIEYLARASPDLPKERFEASADGLTAQCVNFRNTTMTGRKELRTFNQDKGQAAAIDEVLSAVRSGRPSPFTLYEIDAVSRATFAMLESAGTGREIKLQS